MLQRITDRLHREEKGFTLIELMVVVLIIAILIAIAIPTFLGARRRAQDRAAQSSLRNTVTAAKAIFTDNESYATATATELAKSEPSLAFVASGSPSVDSTTVSVAPAPGSPADNNLFVGAALSAAGRCWYVQDTAGPVGAANAGTRWAVDDGPTNACQAGNAPSATSSSWVRAPGSAADFAP